MHRTTTACMIQPGRTIHTTLRLNYDAGFGPVHIMNKPWIPVGLRYRQEGLSEFFIVARPVVDL